MFIASEAFDFMLRRLMEQDNPHGNPATCFIMNGIKAFWTMLQNRLDNVVQQHNRKVATD